MKLTVAICTHEPRYDYLQRVLDALRSQTLPASEWELLLIDNACTVPLAREWDLAWHANARHVRVEELGLTAARLGAIKNAATPLVVFVDDDNVLAPDYLEEAARIAEQWPTLGAWGGAIRPCFERAPPPWTKPYWTLLAVRDVPAIAWSNSLRVGDSHPHGAGLVVRHEVCAAYSRRLEGNQLARMLGRRGNSLMGAEDADLVFTSRELGLGFGMFPTLTLTHLIAPDRLTMKYFTGVATGHATSSFLLDSQWQGRPEPPPGMLSAVIRHLFTSLRHGPRAARIAHAAWIGQRRGYRLITVARLSNNMRLSAARDQLGRGRGVAT